MTSTRLSNFLPFHRPWIGEEEIAEVVDTLRSGWLTLGPKTQRFEEKFAAYIGAKHAVAVASCTAALHLVLESLGVGAGDEVITSPYTFASTVTSILYTGATPVLADTLSDWPNIDPKEVAAKVTPCTKVILPVHFAGASCEMDTLCAIAQRVGATVVDDAAHALPTSYKHKRIGTLGKATAFSFYAGKNMTTGEGGMVTTDDDRLADQVRMRRLHGISRDAWKRYTAEGSWYYEVAMKGFKYNMTDMNAALGLHQLDRLEDFQRRRLALVALYDELLARVPGVTRPVPPADGESAWHLYVIRVDPGIRNDVIDELKADNIGTSVHFIPVHHHRFFQQELGCRKEDYPNATRLYEGAISLPLFPAMSADDVRGVVGSIARVMGKYGP
jgi:dTDP-4-amino-4,6-dideoxygalactose transaminase